MKQQVGGKTSLSDAGANKFSGGRMLQSDGDGLGIEGLSQVTFIFDRTDKLVGSEVPFVGNASAKLKQGDSVIELNAPHMSFTMEVLYLTNGLKQAFQQQSSNERAAKEKKQADMF